MEQEQWTEGTELDLPVGNKRVPPDLSFPLTDFGRVGLFAPGGEPDPGQRYTRLLRGCPTSSQPLPDRTLPQTCPTAPSVPA